MYLVLAGGTAGADGGAGAGTWTILGTSIAMYLTNGFCGGQEQDGWLDVSMDDHAECPWEPPLDKLSKTNPIEMNLTVIIITTGITGWFYRIKLIAA